MSDRARLLFLSQCLPYPPHSGVRARTFNILKQLAVDFDVTLLAFSRKGHQRDGSARRESEQALVGLLQHVDPSVPIPAEQSSARRVWDHLRSLITRSAYTFYEYESAAFRTQLRRLLARATFDLIHIDSPDLHRWLSELPPVPVTCTHHSIESQLLRRQAEWVRSPLLGHYLRHQADLVERVERALCPTFRINLMMSETEAEALRRLAPGARTTVVPNGVDIAYFAPRPNVPMIEGSVVFVGATDTFPNRDAVAHLLRVVWPLVRGRCPKAVLTLIGAGTDVALARHGPVAGVTALGRVADVRPYLAQAACCVVPLRAGGGTRLKILDAWAMGKAVVSTAIGCEGLDAVDGEHLLVRDDPADFAGAVDEVLANGALRSHLGANGRAVAERTYSWDAVGRVLRAAYWNILNSADVLVSR